MNKFVSFLLGIAVALPLSAQLPADISSLNDELKNAYAPDKRIALFQPKYTVDGKHVMLQGETTSAQAHQKLVAGLKAKGYDVMDCLKVFPTADLGDKIYGVVNVSFSCLRGEGDYSSELQTQALLGTPVKILEKDGWMRIQTPDLYLGWVHNHGIVRMNEQELHAWNSAPKIMVTEHYAWVYEKPDTKSQHVSDVCSGNRLKDLGVSGKFYKVGYPDGRVGYLFKENGQPEALWRKNLKQDAQSIIATAKTLLGVPYLWAGMSSKGVDCSGFVRTVLYLHDIIIPRDASQQCYRGEHIEIAPDFSNLQPGDLIFFGRKATATQKERVSHVALYMGDKRFIHSMGDVHISSFDPADELYDEYNLGRLMYAARVLPFIGKDPQLNTTATNPFYQY
ncbi:MAG: NlpC/P60 family protein [Bacteroidales bacterium]|nr:NlpC/P60 family protein [Bacteroidales bacterium]